MGLIDKFEEDFFEGIAGLNIRSFEDYIKENSEEITFLCNHKPHLKEEIEKTLGDLIIEEAIESCYPKLLRGLDLEFLGHPEYFAFAMQKSIFSSDELYKINLQKDSWREDFIKKYSKKDLLKCERERLLSIFE